MLRSALLAAFGLFLVCRSLNGQDINPLPDDFSDPVTLDQLRATGEVNAGQALSRWRPDIAASGNGALLIHNTPALLLIDGRPVADSTFFGRMGLTSADLFPLSFLSVAQVHKDGPSPFYGANAPGGVIDLRLNRSYTYGEVGVFYGQSIDGKSRLQEEQAYLLGGVGNGRSQISVGAFYDHSKRHFP